MKPNETDPDIVRIENRFTIDLVDQYWFAVLDCGQQLLVIRSLFDLNEAVDAICNFFALRSTLPDSCDSLVEFLILLQMSGLVTQFVSETDFAIYDSNMTTVHNIYEFMITNSRDPLLPAAGIVSVQPH